MTNNLPVPFVPPTQSQLTANGVVAPLNPVEQRARTHEIEAVDTLVKVMRNDAARDADKIKAAESILDRARGKSIPTQQTPANAKKKRVVELSEEMLLKLVKRGAQRAKQIEAKPVRTGEIIEAEFTPVKPAKKIPKNPYAAGDLNEIADLLS